MLDCSYITYLATKPQSEGVIPIQKHIQIQK